MRFRAVILLFFFYTAQAQEDNSGVFTLKPSLGLSGCQVHGDTYDGYRKLGLFGGLAVNARLNERTSLELGFYFSQKGSKHIPSKSRPSYYRLNMNYIDLPLLFRYHLNSKYFITLGPSLAYLINYNENEDYIDITSYYTYNSLELALVSGLGRNINKNLQIEVRFSNSITAVRSFPAPVYYPNPVARFFNRGYYNNIVTLMLTYKLSKKHSSETTGS